MPVKISEREKPGCTVDDVCMELSGKDAVRQDEDASAEVRMLANEATNPEMRDGERTEREILGPQGSEPVKVMRNARGPSWKERRYREATEHVGLC